MKLVGNLSVPSQNLQIYDDSGKEIRASKVRIDIDAVQGTTVTIEVHDPEFTIDVETGNLTFPSMKVSCDVVRRLAAKYGYGLVPLEPIILEELSEGEIIKDGLEYIKE